MIQKKNIIQLKSKTIQDNVNKENIPENYKKKNFILSKVKSNKDLKISNKSVNENSENKNIALRKLKPIENYVRQDSQRMISNHSVVIKNIIKSEKTSNNNSKNKSYNNSNNNSSNGVKKQAKMKKNTGLELSLVNKIPIFKSSITPTNNIPVRTNLIKNYHDILKENMNKYNSNKSKEDDKTIEKRDTVCETEVKTEITEEFNNPQIPKEYLSDIYLSLMKEELSIKISNYLDFQNELNDKMRGILIDWLIEVHNKFSLQEETIFLTVNLIDHYLSKNFIPRSKLQLLGVASLLIACKQEEILVPCINDLVYVTDNAYTKSEIFEMEREILKLLEFNLIIPSSLKFLEIIAESFKFTPKMLSFGKYVLCLVLINYKLLKYLPSIIACSASYIVMKYYKKPNYSEIYDGWNMNSDNTTLKDCAKEICNMIDNLNKFFCKAVNKMFSVEKYYQVSNLNLV